MDRDPFIEAAQAAALRLYYTGERPPNRLLAAAAEMIISDNWRTMPVRTEPPAEISGEIEAR